jgi:hypothetical protein
MAVSARLLSAAFGIDASGKPAAAIAAPLASTVRRDRS